MASMASSWDDVVRAASEASGQPRGATLFLLGLALAPAIALGFPILGVALDVARVRDAGVRARVGRDGNLARPRRNESVGRNHPGWMPMTAMSEAAAARADAHPARRNAARRTGRIRL